ncbi:MAG TPA: S8 family serine peptidase [Longimicrobium sp.]
MPDAAAALAPADRGGGLARLYAPLPRPRWARGTTGRGVRVAVIDSGWDHALRVPGLRLRPGVSFAGGAGAPPADDGDRIGHGTACISTLFRVAPEAEICPVRVFGDAFDTSVAALRAALEWAVRERFDVISLSLWTPRADALVPLYAACEEARRSGVVIVAAAPDDPRTEHVYPAVFGSVLSVGEGPFGDPFDYAFRHGAAVECLAAPGDHGAVLWRGGPRDGMWGSSFAAPNVAGIAALLCERHPGAGLEEVRGHLARHARPLPADAEAVRETRRAAGRTAHDAARQPSSSPDPRDA